MMSNGGEHVGQRGTVIIVCAGQIVGELRPSAEHAEVVIAGADLGNSSQMTTRGRDRRAMSSEMHDHIAMGELSCLVDVGVATRGKPAGRVELLGGGPGPRPHVCGPVCRRCV